MDDLRLLSQQLIGEELDYHFLISHLQNYSKPRDKITRYLKNGDLIRIKKGLYVLGENYRKNLVSLEVLANLIYGPSYLSLEYALAFYGFIPERVECLTSITTQKNKLFQTSLGSFSYRHISMNKYYVDLTQQTLDGNRYFIIASPEKAIADILDQQHKNLDKNALQEFLIENLRIDEFRLKSLRKRNLIKLSKVYKSLSFQNLLNYLK